MLCCLSAVVFTLVPNESFFWLKLSLSFETKHHHKRCGTKPAVIIKLSSEPCGVVPAHGGTGRSGSTPFRPLKSLIRRHGSSKSLASFFSAWLLRLLWPGDHGKGFQRQSVWKKFWKAHHVSHVPCQHHPSTTSQLFLRTITSPVRSVANWREGGDRSGGPVSSPQQERHRTKMETQKLPLAPEGRKMPRSERMTRGDKWFCGERRHNVRNILEYWVCSTTVLLSG